MNPKSHLLEEYSELIERDSVEMSFLWKALQIFAYFLGIVTGYSCAILFYIIWQDIFGGRCPIWAKLDLLSKMSDVHNHLHDYGMTDPWNFTDWRQYISASYDSESHCEFYSAVCFLSCIFGIVWLTLFSMCGKGGYDVKIFSSPWRIIIPALLFNFSFAIVTFYITGDITKGFFRFSKDLTSLFVKLSERYTLRLRAKDCDVLQDYASLYTKSLHEYNVCDTFHALENISWIMTWSWITGFILLFVRLVVVNDFRLLKIRIFEIAKDESARIYQAQDQNESEKKDR